MQKARNMKRSYPSVLILAIGFAGLFTCCSRSSSDETPQGPRLVEDTDGSGPCPHPYLPLVKGARWSYQLGEEPTKSSRAELRVGEIQTRGPAITVKVKRTVGPAVTTVEAVCGSDGSSFLALFVPLGPPLPIKLNYVPRITKRAGALLAPPSLLKSGKSWSYEVVAHTANPGGNALTMDSEWSVKVQYAGQREVTVPAGRYDAIQLKLNVSVHHRPPEEDDVTFSGRIMDPPPMELTYSLSKGVGVVLIEGEVPPTKSAKRAYWALTGVDRPQSE